MQLAIRESAHFFDLRGAERLGHVLCWSKILSSPCLLVTQEHRRYLHVCQPRYLSFLSLWSPFPLSRASLSFPLLSYPSFFSLSPSYSSFVLSLSLSLSSLLYPPCSSSFHQPAPARLLLHKHWTQSTIIVMCCRVISGLADRSPSPRSLFLLLLFSVFSLGRRFSRPISHVHSFQRTFDSFSFR